MVYDQSTLYEILEEIFFLNQVSLDLKNSSIENGGGLQAPAHAKELTAVDGCWERKDRSFFFYLFFFSFLCALV